VCCAGHAGVWACACAVDMLRHMRDLEMKSSVHDLMRVMDAMHIRGRTDWYASLSSVFGADKTIEEVRAVKKTMVATLPTISEEDGGDDFMRNTLRRYAGYVMGECVRPCVRASVRPCVRASVRPCVRACVRQSFYTANDARSLP
jgi:hypothetical protein